MSEVKKEKKKIVKPIIVNNNQPHVLEDKDNKDMPILKSIGFGKINPESNLYVSYIITSQGDQVLSIEVSDEDMKVIAMDEAKINFVNTFMDGE